MLSLLDTDLYKLTTQQVIFNNFPNLQVKYKLFDRKNKVLPLWDVIYPKVENKIYEYRNSRVSFEEYRYLQSLNLFDNKYLDYLYYNYNPDYSCGINLTNGIEIQGTWLDCVLWEIPLLQFINEVYIEVTEQKVDLSTIIARIDSLNNLSFSEFGSRRRANYLSQEVAISRMKFNGGKNTSNVHFAMKYGLTPTGTFGHEGPMCLSGLMSEDDAQLEFIKLMKKEFPNKKIYGLSDTFTTDRFLERFIEVEYLTSGLRQDSGSPEVFLEKTINWYNKNNIDYSSKELLFTDNLNYDKCNFIQNLCDNKYNIKNSYGIGTWLSNPCLNRPDTVIKPIISNDQKIRKLSDNPEKSILF